MVVTRRPAAVGLPSATILFAVLVLLPGCRRWNNPPSVPSHPSPSDHGMAGDSGLVLSWQSQDPDIGDSIHFHVSFGASTPPQLVDTNCTDTTYEPNGAAAPGQYYWQVVAFDNHGDSGVGPIWQFQIAGPLTITAPDTGELLRMYSEDTIAWTGGPTSTRGAGAAKGTGRVSDGGVGPDALDSTVVYRSADDGVTWLRVGLATTVGQYVWQVPSPATDSARVRVVAFSSGDTLSGTSGRFRVISDTTPPSPIEVTAPDSTARWNIGSVHDVTWTGGAGADSSVIYFSTDNGLSWTRQAQASTQGVLAWTVSGPATTQARVEVRAYNASGLTTGRSGAFVVASPPYPDSVVAITGVGDRPSALCYDSIDNRAFVACWSDTSLAVIDGVTNYVIGRVGVGGFSSSVLWNPSNNRVYAASETRNTVTVLDAATLSVVDTVAVGAKPVALCWNRTNNKVYVANNRDSSVTVIDGATNQVIATAAVGGSPVALAWNPVNNTVYVANFGASGATAIDGADNTAENIPLGYYYPCAVVVDTIDNEVYVAHRNDAQVSVIDAAANQVVATVPADQQPWALAWNPTQNRVYCANSQDGTVLVINPANHSVADDVTVAAQPRALFWSAPTGKLYVACNGAGSVAIIDGANNTVAGTVAVGNKPSALGWNGRENKAYVANYDDGTISVLGAGAKGRR